MYTPIRIQSSPEKLGYIRRFNGFGGFGAVLSSNQILSIGQQCTFTFTFPWYSQYPSDSDAISFLNSSLRDSYGVANVVNASRALFSSNYVVTFVPLQEMTAADFQMAFDDAWNNAPWYVAKPSFVQAEAGETSSRPGGIQGVIPEITGSLGETVGQGIASAAKPLLPYILIGGGILVLIYFGPTLMKRRML